MATITNLTSGIEVDFAGAVTYIKHGNVKLLKRGTNINIYDDSDDDGNQRGQIYITIKHSEVTSPVTADIDALYTAVKGYIDVSSGGGGTSSPLTTKGDLYSFDTDNSRLPIGTDGQALVADSTEATGLKWKNLSETPAVGGGLLVDLGMVNTDQSITVASGATTINFDDTLTGAIDKNGDWDNTNKKFIVSSTSGDGTYQFEVNLFAQNTTAGYYNLQAFVNGSIKPLNGAFAMSDAVDDSGYDGVAGTISIDLVVGDEVEIKLQSYNTTTTISANTWNFAQAMRISKASGIKGEKGDTGAPTDTRVTSVTSIGTLIVDSSTTDQSIITAQAEALTIAAPTGTPVEGQKLIIRIKDDGSARAITFNAIFRAIGVTLPTTTVASKITYLGLVYNSTDTKWDIVATKTEA